ncbi:sugar phosphate isomerase/epimerase [Paenibacillus sp. R14(2021)]|uniref:sugar phosphate isomerase/epimerase family protein n=1 Tax=Paenibacillus sp. R14(2021) TaxID=2859228 RepID=UPI001C61442C|nr:TIM barrel protein [Paenibacillus sp. R14(2021)]
MGASKGAYSFSTCWNIKRHAVGREMADEIRALGFHRVELNYNVTREHLRTIEPMIERGEIGVSSVHNTFPHIEDPDYGTDSVLLGFDDEEKRRRAVDLLVQSAEYANRYGAKAVVVHPGEVPFDYNIDETLKGIYKEQGPDSQAYRKLWDQMLDRRESLSGHYLRRIQHSLEEACERIAAKGWDVALGIETRSRCYQMPTLAEAKTIIDSMKGAPLYLWYDIGHGMMMERMGLYDNANEANAMKDDIIGVHIHETIGLSDHYCPYVHSKDDSYFDRFLAIIDQAPIKVYELKAACRPEEIEQCHEQIVGKIEARKGLIGGEK